MIFLDMVYTYLKVGVNLAMVFPYPAMPTFECGFLVPAGCVKYGFLQRGDGATVIHTFLPCRTLLDWIFMIDGLKSVFPFI